MSLRGRVPWWLKIGLKMAWSRLPLPHRLWHRLGVFRHGAMQSPDYAFAVVARHLGLAGLRPPLTGMTVLEFGPGDSLFGAVIARGLGAERTWLIDAGPFAVEAPAAYRAMAAFLAAKGWAPPDLGPAQDLEGVLRACGATYLTGGLASLARIPDASVDFAWSQAVLEHVRKDEFDATLRELRRVLKPGGVASHRVDLRDHLADALNSLRFAEARWESPLFVDSGFYTNRIRLSDMRVAFAAAGFAVEVAGVERWDALPTPRRALAPPFRDMSEDDLRVRGFDVLLRREDG